MKSLTFMPEIEPDEDGYERELLFVFSGHRRGDRRILSRIDGECAYLPEPHEVSSDLIEVRQKIYVGSIRDTEERIACWAVEADGATSEYEQDCEQTEFEYRSLRSLFGLLPDHTVGAAGTAAQLIDWDRQHRYCGACGKPTVGIQGERAKRCDPCGLLFFPRISPAIIVAVMKGDRILLAHNRRFPGDMYSLIAGFVEPGESLEDAVRREVAEEVSIEVDDIRYFGSQPWPFPNSLMLGFTARYAGGELHPDGVEIGDAGWYVPDEFPTIPGFGSISRKIIDSYVENYGS